MLVIVDSYFNIQNLNFEVQEKAKNHFGAETNAFIQHYLFI